MKDSVSPKTTVAPNALERTSAAKELALVRTSAAPVVRRGRNAAREPAWRTTSVAHLVPEAKFAAKTVESVLVSINAAMSKLVGWLTLSTCLAVCACCNKHLISHSDCLIAFLPRYIVAREMINAVRDPVSQEMHVALPVDRDKSVATAPVFHPTIVVSLL